MSLVARYKFNDPATFTTDDSGNSNTLTNVNNVGSVNDATYGTAASFDADNMSYFSLASAPAAITGSSSRTFSYWVRALRTGVSQVLHSQGVDSANEYRFQLQNSGNFLQIYHAGLALVADVPTTYFLGSWSHISITRGGTNEILYLDGVSLQSGNTNVNTETGPLYIGASTRFPGVSFDGEMLDFRIYDGALSSTEVMTLFTDGPNGSDVPLPPLVLEVRSVNILAIVAPVDGAIGYNITYEGPTGGEIVAFTGTTDLSYNIVGLDPSTPYTVKLYADIGTGLVLEETLTTTTLANVAANYDLTDFQDNGVTDLTLLDSASISIISSDLFNLITTGDTVNLTINEEVTSNSFVATTGNLDVSALDGGILLPFDTNSGSGQAFDLTLSDLTTTSVTYDDLENTVAIDSIVYGTGDTFILDGNFSEIAEVGGLLVIGLEDITPTAAVPLPTEILTTVTDFGGTRYNITYEGPTGGEITAFSNVNTLENNITGLEPNTQYTIRTFANTSNGFVLVDETISSTLENIASNYDKQDYAENGIFNLRSLMQSSLQAIQSVLDGVFNTGDVLGLSVPGKPIDASFINIADNLSIGDVDAVIIPFATTNGSGQDVTVTLSDESIVTVAFDDAVNTITIDNVTYGPGDSFILDGKKVTVLDS